MSAKSKAINPAPAAATADRSITPKEAVRLVQGVLPYAAEHSDDEALALMAIIHLLAYDPKADSRDINATTLLIAIYDRTASHDTSLTQFAHRVQKLLGPQHNNSASVCY